MFEQLNSYKQDAMVVVVCEPRYYHHQLSAANRRGPFKLDVAGGTTQGNNLDKQEALI